MSAKGNATSTGSTSATGSSCGLFGGFFATRGDSLNADGSGAPFSTHLDLRHRALSLFAAAFVFLGLAIVLGAPQASAEQKQLISAFGGSGGEEGKFAGTGDVAVNPTTDELYVIDLSNARVQQFDGAGNFIRTWGWGVIDGAEEFQVCTAACIPGIVGSGDGQFNFGSFGQVAIGADGSVYITDDTNNRIQKFSPTGAYLSQFSGAGEDEGELAGPIGLAIDPTTGDILVGGGNRVRRFDETGTFISAFGSSEVFPSGPNRLAVDSTGAIYTYDQGGGPDHVGEVRKWTASGSSSESVLSSFINSEEFRFISDVEIDPATGHIFTNVTNGPADFSEVTTTVWELDASGTVLEKHSNEVRITFASGLAVSPTSGQIYVSDGGETQRVFILGENVLPNASVDPPFNVTKTGATFTGRVDPEGVPTSYRFEYSTDGIKWTAVKPDESVGEGVGDVEVQDVVTGLTPNTLYRVRIVVGKEVDGFTIRSQSSELTFLTDADGPVAITAAPQNYADTSARLVGSVNPNGSPTSYFFDIGKTTSYGDQVPLPAGNAGTGTGTKFFQATAIGLEPSTTYHYRIVAESDLGTSKGADRTFTTRAPFVGFPDRAYEQVSPPDKRGLDVLDGAYPAAANGERAMFEHKVAIAGQDFGGSGGAIGSSQYVSQRTSTGWVTKPVWPRLTSTGDQLLLQEVSTNLEKAVSYSQGFAKQSEPLSGYYLFDLLTGTGTVDSLTYTLPWNIIQGNMLVGGSPDLDHVVRREGNEWVNGETRQVIRAPLTDEPFPTGAVGGVSPGSVIEPEGEFTGRAEDNIVSADGNHIFFSSPISQALTEAATAVFSTPSTQIYRRDNGTETILVSPSSVTDPQGPKAKVFQAATPGQGPDDPAAVFFTSSEQLTADANTGPSRAGRDLYRYEINTDTLTNISAETNDTDGAQVTFFPLLGYSDDGDWVYYVARGQVLAGQGVVGKPNVYLWHDDGTPDGVTRFITTFPTTGACNTARESCNYTINEGLRSSRVSDDGQSLLFQSTQSLTGYPNQGFSQIYLYEVDGNGGAGSLSCVSCRPDGIAAHSDTLVPVSDRAGVLRGGEPMTAMSRDGSQVFFTSAEKLVPQDGNGASDPYEWNEGQLSLISTGTNLSDSSLGDATPDGKSVFFFTREPLVGQDEDADIVDLYVARVGGGIAAQNAPPPGEPCASSDQCKPPSPATPPAPVAPSATLHGSGNVNQGTPGPRKCKKGKVLRKGKCVKKNGKKGKGSINRRGGK